MNMELKKYKKYLKIEDSYKEEKYEGNDIEITRSDISGIGKSITLLHFLKEYNNLATCYFNVRELHKYN